MGPEIPLQSLQEFMLAAVSHQDGLEQGLGSNLARAAAGERTIDDIILPSRTMTARERLRIYADMYYWRLVDVLAETFSRTRSLVGPPSFVGLARDFLHHHPSQHPNLSQLGLGFPHYLRHEAKDLEERLFVADLAEFELACDLSFDAAETRPIDAEAVAAISPENWDEVVLEMVATARVLKQSHPLDAWIDAGCSATEIPEPELNWLLVYRQDLEVMRLPLDKAAGRCLFELQKKSTLMTALEAAAEIDGFEAISRNIAAWFRSWTSLGLFKSISPLSAT